MVIKLLLVSLLVCTVSFLLLGCESPFRQEYEKLNESLEKNEIGYIEYLQRWYQLRIQEIGYYLQRLKEWLRKFLPPIRGPIRVNYFYQGTFQFSRMFKLPYG